MSERMLRVELHSHTVYSSDGHMRFETMVRMARRRRLDVIAITDHDTMEGAAEFRKLNSRYSNDLHIIVGEERTLADKSHVIGLFLREPLQSLDFESVVREIGEQGGVCVFPHPFRRKDGAFRVPRAPLEGTAVCFEMFNPKCTYDENRAARQLLAEGWTAVGGSDAHYESDLGEAVNLVPFENDVEESVRRALTGGAPLQVLGLRQTPGAQGRKYAALYYRVKPFARVPRPLVPMVSRMYRALRNSVQGRRLPALEVVHCNDEKPK